jgi:hypothetical protein
LGRQIEAVDFLNAPAEPLTELIVGRPDASHRGRYVVGFQVHDIDCLIRGLLLTHVVAGDAETLPCLVVLIPTSTVKLLRPVQVRLLLARQHQNHKPNRGHDYPSPMVVIAPA